MPKPEQHADLLSLFQATHASKGLSATSVDDLLEFAEVLYRENQHLRSQIETDEAYRNELEVEKLGLQIEIHNLKGEKLQ